MLSLGTQAPDFSLIDTVSNSTVSLNDFTDKPLLVAFICRHCPFVKHIQSELAKIGHDYSDLAIVAICSNDPTDYPEDAPESLKEQAEELGFNFPYLFDETQEVAKAYSAACTPDFFLFDKVKKLVYRGQIDDSRPDNDISVTGQDLRMAIEAVLSNQPVNPDQKPSIGCSIKWKE